jgi:hypothetical protein
MKGEPSLYSPLFFAKASRGVTKRYLMFGNNSDCGYDSNSNSIYEILIVACSVYGLPCRFLQRRAATSACPTSGRQLSAYSNRAIPAATAI